MLGHNTNQNIYQILYLKCLIIVSLLVHLNAGQGLYSILAPNTLRPNSQYHVAVSIHKAPEPVKVKVGIIGSTYSDFKTAEVRPLSTEMIHFEIPALKRDRYSLTAEGLAGIGFTNETQLNFDAKQYTVMVQSDKAIYKPQDIVHFRVLVLDANLKPAFNYGRVHITVKDGGNNVIRKYQDVRLMSGTYANDLELSDYPKFGEWSVEVEVDDETYRRTFEVVEYILPKFVVDIDTDKHVIYKDGKIRALIKAYYDFGKPIVGEATLSIYPTFFGSLQPFVNDLITRKIVPIDGSAFFEFDIKNELKLKEDYEREYLLDALVEETSTSSAQNFSAVITIHLDTYRVEAIKLPSNYVPGVPFEVSAKVSSNKGALMRDFKSDLTAYLTNVYGSSEMYNKTVYTLDSRAEVKMKFTVPVGDKDEYHSIIVDYQGIITDIGKVPRKHLHSKNFITAKILNDKPMTNQEITIAVRCSEPMKYFVYQIVGRGDILLSRAVDVPDNAYHTFKFLSTFAMMPRAKLLVYTVMNGEFVYDEQVIVFEQNLLNSVLVQAPLRAPPGQDIDITISSKPYNYIGIMVVDQNALNIRKGNDLSTSNLLKALNQYDLNDVNTHTGSPGKESGIITMTNTDLIVEKQPETTPALERAVHEDEHKLTTIRKTDIGPAHAIETNTLAPGKGRYAFSYTPKPFWHNPRIHVMHPPADTWLFMNVSAGSEGKTTIHRRLPSSITSWVVSAFALDPVQGIGLAVPTKMMRTFKDFYITTELPYSIRLGETIALPFVVFNNKDEDLSVDVTLYNTAQEFDFVQIDGSKTQAKPKIELYSRRSLRIPAKSSKSVAFIVIPKRVGAITIKAVAANQLAGDSVESTLLVEYPGATETVNRGFLFEMGSSVQRQANVSIRIPRNSIIDSAKIEISAVGDVVGSILGNMENLIRLPSGGGEQTMIQFMPNLMVLKYLQRTHQLSPSIEVRAKKNLELGYQRLLYYRQESGGFSAFGLNEEKSSTWLTAYVAKVFRMANEFIQIDEDVINSALNYVVSMQTVNGDFEEKGTEFENFDDKSLILSAFVTMSLLENLINYPQYKNNINKALDFIAKRLDSSDNVQSLAIGSYVLTKANHNAKVAFIQRLDAMSVNQGGFKWWNKSTPASESLSPWYNVTRSVNIEISSYAILSLLENNLIGDALPAIKWLMNQRNDLGGFVSSQDSVVGLQALVAFAERFSSQANNLQLLFKYGQNAETVLNVNAQNSLVLQTIELPNNLKNLTISATGNGLALAQVTYRYNTNVTSAWPRFVLDPTVNRNSHPDYLHLSSCVSFIPAEGDANRSNMAVMEIHLPSGFIVDTDTLPTLESSERIKKVETQKRNTVVVIYFDYLDRREVCPTLHAYKVVKVTNHKPVPVVMYDYYDNVRRARQFYRAPKSQICDICEHANCGQLCEKAEKRESRRFDSDINELLETSGAAGVIAVNTMLTIFSFVFFKILN